MEYLKHAFMMCGVDTWTVIAHRKLIGISTILRRHINAPSFTVMMFDRVADKVAEDSLQSLACRAKGWKILS